MLRNRSALGLGSLGRIAMWGVATLSTGAIFSCSQPEKIPGSMVIAIQTDMSARKDIDAVGIVITRDRQVVYEGVQAIAPTVYFPSTLVAYSYDKPAPIMVRVYAFKDGKARILRKAITIVPADRKALLRMPIDWVNDGSAEGQIAVSDRLAQVIDANAQEKDFEPVGEPKLTSTCGANQTMIDGTCTDARIDPATLPDYKPEEVFGGGDGGVGGGTCFDTLPCFANAAPVNKTPWTVQGGECVAEPASDLVNALAFRLPPGSDGFCSGEACFVPLDTNPEDGTKPSVRLDNGLLRAPERFCEKLSQGRSIVRSATCGAKGKETPVCSEASSVGPRPDAGTVIPSSGIGELVASDPTTRPLSALTPFVWNRWIAYGNIDGVWLRLLSDASVPVATGFVKSEVKTLSISNDGYLVRVNASDVRALRLPASPVKDQGNQQYSVGQERIWYNAPLTRTIAGSAYQNQVLTSVLTEVGGLSVAQCPLVNQDGPGTPLCNATPIATLSGGAAWITGTGAPVGSDVLVSTNAQLSKCSAEAPVAQKCAQHVPAPAGGPVVVGGGAAVFLDKSGKILRAALAPTPVETFDQLVSGQTFPQGRESLTADANFVYFLRESAGKQQIAAIDVRGKGPVFPAPRVVAELELSDVAPSPTKPRIDGLSSSDDGYIYFGYWDPAAPNNQRAQLRRLPKPAL